jgi:hypothetical protein
MLKVIIKVRQDIQMTEILNVFSEFRLALKTEEDSEAAFNLQQESLTNALSILDFNVEKYTSLESQNDSEKYHLDLDLLKLVFNVSKSKNKEVEREALEVII